MAQNHLKLETPLFARFLMCASIIFLWVAAQGPKSGFFYPKLGARLKKHGFEGSQVHPQKVYRRTHSEEGGTRYTSPGLFPICRHGSTNIRHPLTACSPFDAQWYISADAHYSGGMAQLSRVPVVAVESQKQACGSIDAYNFPKKKM